MRKLFLLLGMCIIFISLIYAVGEYPYATNPYTAVNGWNLDESSGNSADVIGSRTGTITGITYSTGKFNNGAIWDASGDYIDVGDNTLFGGETTFTLSLWVKWTDDGNDNMIIGNRGAGGDNDLNFNAHTASINTMRFQVPAESIDCRSGTNVLPTSGSWNHTAITYNSTHATIWLDGVKVANCAGSYGAIATTYNNYAFGSAGASSIRPYIGMMDDIYVFYSVLSDDEIINIADEGFVTGEQSDLYVVNNTINFTSDGGQICGFNGSEYSTCGGTFDLTPTFSFDTNGDSTCKIWNESLNYTTLDGLSVADCGTTGTSSHICTFPDNLKSGINTLYASCQIGDFEMNTFIDANIFNVSVNSPFGGTVKDGSDNPFLNATVYIINQSSNTIFSVQYTDEFGEWSDNSILNSTDKYLTVAYMQNDSTIQAIAKNHITIS